MDYYRTLAAALRQHGASEDQVAGEVAAARTAAERAGLPPQEVLGPPHERARRLHPGSAVTLGHRVTIALVTATVLLTLASWVLPDDALFGDVPPVAISVPGTLLALALGYAVDRRPPRSTARARA
ncbi:MAG: hypothetical protein U0Q15_00240 [Kineosporiaceae bacterium]